MKLVRPWARPRHAMLGLCFCIMTGVIAAQPAGAQTDTPYVWREMQPNAFDASIATAREQCIRAFLLPADCDEFADKLAAGEYVVIQVPDGTRYGYMNYSQDGEPYLQGSTVKRLGEDTPAWRVQLSSGRILDWYTGFDGACNNVGVDPREPTLTPPPKRAVLPPRGTPQQWGSMNIPPRVHHVPGLDVCGCVYLPGTTFVQPGSTFVPAHNWNQ